MKLKDWYLASEKLLEDQEALTNNFMSWLEEKWDKNYEIPFHKSDIEVINGAIHVLNNSLRLTNISEIPYPIGACDSIYITFSTLTSFRNFPKKLRALDVTVGEIKSFDGFPEEIALLNLYDNKMTSLHGVYMHLTSMDSLGPPNISKSYGSIYIDKNPIKSHMLGMLKIKGFRSLVIDDEHDSKEMVAAAHIVNKYANQGNAGLVKAQRELIEADLDEYAEL